MRHDVTEGYKLKVHKGETKNNHATAEIHPHLFVVKVKPCL